jgi:hypothetical protein
MIEVMYQDLLLTYCIVMTILIFGFICLAASSVIEPREWPGMFWVIGAGPEAWTRCRKILNSRQRVETKRRAELRLQRDYRTAERAKLAELEDLHRDLRMAAEADHKRLLRAEATIRSVQIAQDQLIVNLEVYHKLAQAPKDHLYPRTTLRRVAGEER